MSKKYRQPAGRTRLHAHRVLTLVIPQRTSDEIADWHQYLYDGLGRRVETVDRTSRDRNHRR